MVKIFSILFLLAAPFLMGFTADSGISAENSSVDVNSDCTFNNFKLYGKIQFVDAFPDIKVQVVDAFPDLKVKIVDAFPDDCGEWQIVDAFPDLKVQIVDAFPDVKIQYVDAFPGIQ